MTMRPGPSTPWQRRLVLPLVFFLAFFSATTVRAQEDPASAERQLADLRDEIRAEEARLAAAERTEKASVEKLNSISRQIDMRQELVGRYENRLRNYAVERDSLFGSIESLESELARLKNDYRRRATNAYRYGRLHDLALILSASSINEMLVRVQYLNRFSSTRRSRLTDISETAELLKQRRTELQRMLVRNEVLLNDAQEEKSELSKLKRTRKVEVDRIRSQRDQLSQNLAEKRTSAEQLGSRVRVLLADESTRREETGSETSNALHDADTQAFKGKKGQLPWPVAGTLKEPFGEVINPANGTRTNNLHIVVATEASAEVKAVAGGRVSALDIMPEYGRFVLVEHGDYLTFYGNLSLFYVSTGDTVEPGQIIGRAGTDAEPKGRAIFFGVFDNGTAVDPQTWLSPR